jgi:DNA-binding NarL/FixJ family response regulator
MALLAAISQLNIQPEAMDETEEAANKVSGETKTVNERERQLPVLLREKHRFQPPTIDQARNALQTLQRLTHRQHEVIELYGEGLTASEISQRLGISCQTVADIRHDAMRRLGVKTVMELVGKVTRLSIEASFVAPHW